MEHFSNGSSFPVYKISVAKGDPEKAGFSIPHLYRYEIREC
jgi:hypothetical protein